MTFHLVTSGQAAYVCLTHHPDVLLKDVALDLPRGWPEAPRRAHVDSLMLHTVMRRFVTAYELTHHARLSALALLMLFLSLNEPPRPQLGLNMCTQAICLPFCTGDALIESGTRALTSWPRPWARRCGRTSRPTVTASCWAPPTVSAGPLVSVRSPQGPVYLDASLIIASNHLRRRTAETATVEFGRRMIVLHAPNDMLAREQPAVPVVHTDMQAMLFANYCIAARLQSPQLPVNVKCFLLTMLGRQVNYVTAMLLFGDVCPYAQPWNAQDGVGRTPEASVASGSHSKVGGRLVPRVHRCRNISEPADKRRRQRACAKDVRQVRRPTAAKRAGQTGDTA